MVALEIAELYALSAASVADASAVSRPEVAAPYCEASDSSEDERAGFVAAADVRDSTFERAEEYIEAYALYALSVAMFESAEVAAATRAERSVCALTEAATAKKSTEVKRMLTVYERVVWLLEGVCRKTCSDCA